VGPTEERGHENDVNLLRKEPQQKTQTVSDNGKYY
jgi:hypothetical protein